MPEFYMWGGYSYSVGDAETFPTVEVAILKYAERARNGGTFKTDGVFHPTWGEMSDDEYAITSADGDDCYTLGVPST